MESKKAPFKQSELVKETATIEQLTKQVAKGGGIALIGSIFGKVATFGLHILLGRLLGPGTYGLYALGTSVTGIARSVGGLGLNSGVVRFCSIYRGEKDNARVKGTILSALAISLVFSIIVSVILFVFSGTISESFFNEPELTSALRVFALAVPFYVVMGITTSFAQAFRRIEYQQGVQNICRPLVNVVLVGLAFLLGFRLAGAVYGFLASGVLSAGLGLYLLWKIFPEIRSKLRPLFNVKLLFNFSLPLFFTGFTYVVLNQTDRILLAHYIGARDVGVYNSAVLIVTQLTLMLNALIAIFSPIVADLYNRRKLTELRLIYKTVTRWSFSYTLPLFISLVFYSHHILAATFGEKFLPGATPLVLIACAQMFNVSTGPSSFLLAMSGHQNIIVLNNAVMILLNVTLNMWWIPIYGMVGAALATAIAISLIHVIALVEVYVILKVSPYDMSFFKPLLAGFLATTLAFMLITFTNVHWFFQMTLSGASFVLTLSSLSLSDLILGFKRRRC